MKTIRTTILTLSAIGIAMSLSSAALAGSNCDKLYHVGPYFGASAKTGKGAVNELFGSKHDNPKYEAPGELDSCDGSEGCPFGTIGEALARANKEQACSVWVLVDAGSYNESLSITMTTRITGAFGGGTVLLGNLTNSGPNTLKVERLTLQDSAAPAAIRVDHPSAGTILTDVTINRAAVAGIWQTGGWLRASSLRVSSTRSLPSAPLQQGAAIHIEGAAQARLSNVALVANEGNGLLAEGNSTRVHASAMTVRATRHNPNYADLETAVLAGYGFAGIMIHDEAELYGQNILVEDNDVLGVLVQDGANAHLRDIDVRRTTVVQKFGGSNIAVDSAGLELHDFTSSHATVGLVLVDAQFHAYDGVSHNNYFGVAFVQLTTGSYSDYKCAQNVTLQGNTERYSFWGFLPVPEICFDGLEACTPPPPVCHSVPWIP